MNETPLFVDRKKKAITITEIVFQQLRDAILEGYYKEGEKLSTESIRKKLNVSRMPVREAFRKLETEGLVVVHPQIGVTVSEISIKELNELTEVRLLTEKYSLRQAMLNMREEDYGLLEEKIIREEREQKVDERVWIRNSFHLELCKYANNKILFDTVEKFLQKFNRYIFLHAKYIDQTTDYNHRELFEIVKTKDIDKSLNFLENHIKSMSDEINRILIRKKNNEF